MPEIRKPKIFISYSHADEEWKDKILKFFTSDKMDLWDDGCIKLGDNWYNEIILSLHNADIGLLLISQNFLTSEFIKKEEIPIFLERCKTNKIMIVCVYISSFPKTTAPDWLLKQGEGLQGFPSPNKQLSDFIGNNLNKKLSELVDKVYNDYKDNLKLKQVNKKALEPLSDLISFLSQTYTIDEILEICQKYLDRNIILELKKYSNVKEIISHIYHNNQFSCIINDLNKDGALDNYLRENPPNNCKEITVNRSEPHITIIFREEDENIYEVTFKNKNLSHKRDETDSKRYNLKENKEELTKDIMEYVGTDNPTVDLVLPSTLMTKDINLWEVEAYCSLNTLAKVNIRDYNRYNMNEKLKQDKLIPTWDKLMEKSGLFFIDTEEKLRKVGNNMKEKGILAENILEKKHFDYLLKTEMSYIMVWKTKESTFDMSSLKESALQQDYYTLKGEQINMMYDDPNTYY